MENVKISILIPVYNEERTIEELLCRVRHAPLPEHCTKEVIVVDDGSRDGTAAILRKFIESESICVLRLEHNHGKGAAIRKGLTAATGDIVLIQDADLEYDPNHYIALITPLLEGHADVVYGSRFLGNVTRMRRRNQLANLTLTSLTNWLYGTKLSDQATGYKVLRMSLARRIQMRCQGFNFCSELTAKVSRLGYRIHEVPISYQARTVSEGKKIRSRDWLRAIWALVSIRLANSPSRDVAVPLNQRVSAIQREA